MTVLHLTPSSNRWSYWGHAIISVCIILVISTVYWRYTIEDRDLIQRNFWDVFYDRCSLLYDSVDWLTFDATQNLRLRVFDYLPTANVSNAKNESYNILEVGLGTGRLHVELAKRCSKEESLSNDGFYLAGFDMAPGMIQLTRKRLDGLKSDLRIGDLTQELPWDDDTFDVVLSTFVLSAISDATAACREMSRVLKPGGKLIIVDAGAAQDGNRVASVLAWLWELLGDYMRDESAMLSQLGLKVTREDFGPWHSVHVTVGEKAKRSDQLLQSIDHVE